MFSECLNISQTVCGNNHPDLAIYLTNIADIYKCMGKYKEAL